MAFTTLSSDMAESINHSMRKGVCCMTRHETLPQLKLSLKQSLFRLLNIYLMLIISLWFLCDHVLEDDGRRRGQKIFYGAVVVDLTFKKYFSKHIKQAYIFTKYFGGKVNRQFGI